MTEKLLKPPNLLRKWRLRDVQPLRSAAEMQLLGNSDKISQMPDFNVTEIHIQYILIAMNKILDVSQAIILH